MIYSFNLDLDPMILILRPDIDVVKMYLHTKNMFLDKSYSLNRQTDRQSDTHIHTHRLITCIEMVKMLMEREWGYS